MIGILSAYIIVINLTQKKIIAYRGVII